MPHPKSYISPQREFFLPHRVKKDCKKEKRSYLAHFADSKKSTNDRREHFAE